MSAPVPRRPTVDGATGALVTTPIAAAMIGLLGSSPIFGSVALTKDEWRAVQKLYGFTDEAPNERPPPPAPPVCEKFKTTWDFDRAVQEHAAALKAWERWEDPRLLMQAGADRNAIRHAEADGLRCLAWLARHIPAGEDPLTHVVQLAIDAGWDVDPSDCAWANELDAAEAADGVGP